MGEIKYIFDKRALFNHGVLHIPAFFKGALLDAVQADLRLLLNDDSRMVDRTSSAHFFQKYQSTSYCFVNQIGDFDNLSQLPEDVLLNAILKEIFPEGYSLLLSLAQHNKAGEGQAIPWHQDVHHEQVGVGQVYNFLLYPQDTTEESGALYYVEGSHKLGRLPKGEPHDPLPGETRIVPKAGDLIITDCLLFHRVNHNRSRLDRTSINLRFHSSDLDAGRTRIGVYRNGQVNYAG